jgi:chorismate mutase/prephenate dehydratase
MHILGVPSMRLAIMNRKPENGNGNTTPSPRVTAQVAKLRGQIDKLDQQILKLVNERAACAQEIGQYKTEQGAEIFSPVREEEIIQAALANSPGPLQPTTVRSIFRELISGCRSLQQVLKVAYLGPEYSFSHLAAIERFGTAVDFLSVGSIMAVFEEVNRGHVDFGVVPLENSNEGRIADTLDMFIRLPQIKVCAEVRLRVHHHLMANCPQAEIRRIYSNAQALGQCRIWLSKNVPHAQLVPVTSTSIAAELAQREPGAGAVASRQAAVKYGLKLLFSDIEDNPANETRFAVLGKQPAERGPHNKTAIMFLAAHHPGSLVDILNVFKQNKINLSMIESFPSRSEKQKYVFFTDFEGHVDEPKTKRTIEGLQKLCDKLVVLGSFPTGDLLE